MNLNTVETLEPTSPVGMTAKAIMEAWCRNFSPDGFFRFHDPVVPFAVEERRNFRATRLSVCCDESSEEFAYLIETPDGHHAGLFEPGDNQRATLRDRIVSSLGLTPGEYR